MENEKEKNADANEKALQKIKEEIEKIQFGSVTAVIHDGQIIQVDTNTKLRFK